MRQDKGGGMAEPVFSTSEVARMVGIHPNTVRLYEELKLIPIPERRENGYRIYTQRHINQLKLVRRAFEVEVLQNGLRKQMIEVIKTAAAGEFEEALRLNDLYLKQIDTEIRNAEEAVTIVGQLMEEQYLLPAGGNPGDRTAGLCLTRKEAAEYLNVTMDTLRNWELNGLMTIKRKKNGYRVYDDEDMKRLKIIRSLRCANYSLASILRMLGVLSENPQADIRAAIDTAQDKEDIITACDQLLTSLSHAKSNSLEIREMLLSNPPL